MSSEGTTYLGCPNCGEVSDLRTFERLVGLAEAIESWGYSPIPSDENCGTVEVFGAEAERFGLTYAFAGGGCIVVLIDRTSDPHEAIRSWSGLGYAGLRQALQAAFLYIGTAESS
jgi:hypothetical protein